MKITHEINRLEYENTNMVDTFAQQKIKNEVFIYYASSDTRMHVATSTVDKLIDYCKNTPEDGLRSAASVAVRNELISANLKLLQNLV